MKLKLFIRDLCTGLLFLITLSFFICQIIFYKMSIDVFGRLLLNSDSVRGPPGLGFKLTTDGQFNLENKRLCNVADAFELNDCVNLKVLQRVTNNEFEKILKITTAMKNEMNQLSTSSSIFEMEIRGKLKEIESSISALENRLQMVQESSEQANEALVLSYNSLLKKIRHTSREKSPKKAKNINESEANSVNETTTVENSSVNSSFLS